MLLTGAVVALASAGILLCLWWGVLHPPAGARATYAALGAAVVSSYLIEFIVAIVAVYSGLRNARPWQVVAHIAAFLPMPLGAIAGPTLIWGIRRRNPPIVDQVKKALNFQISAQIYYVSLLAVSCFGLTSAAWISGAVMDWFEHHGATCGTAVVVYMVAWQYAWAAVVATVALRTSVGRPADYPLSVRFIG